MGELSESRRKIHAGKCLLWILYQNAWRKTLHQGSSRETKEDDECVIQPTRPTVGLQKRGLETYCYGQ